jgi:YVTN family beta-propeller protein
MVLKITRFRRAVFIGSLTLMIQLAAAQTPSPAVVMATRGIGGNHAGLAIADPMTGKVVATVPIDAAGPPHEVAVSADGKLAFVTTTNYGRVPGPIPQGTISVIDLVAQKELSRVEVGVDSIPHGIVFAGGKVYFTAEGFQNVERYDPVSGRIDWMIGTARSGTHMLAVSKNGDKMYSATNDSDVVVAIEPWDHQDHRTTRGPRNPWMTTIIPVGKGPEGIALSPDEKEVWVLNHEGGTASIIDVATRKVVSTLDLKTKAPLRLRFTLDGKRVMICDEFSGEVMVLDAVTRKEIKRITNVGKTLHGIVMASDGSHAFVTDIGAGKVAMIDLKTLEVTGNIITPAGPEGIAWAERK